MLVNTIITKKSLAYNLQFPSLKYASSIYPLWIFRTSFPKHVTSEDERKGKEKVEIITEAMCLY